LSALAAQAAERTRIARQRKTGDLDEIRDAVLDFLDECVGGTARGPDIREEVAKRLEVPEGSVAKVMSQMVRSRKLDAEYSRQRGGGKLYRRYGTGMPADADGAKTEMERRAIDAVEGPTTIAEALSQEPTLGHRAKEIFEGLVRRGALVRGPAKDGRGSYERP
jgi:hypothetical protein